MAADAQRRAFNVMLVEVGRGIPAPQLPALFLLHDLCAAEREDCGNAVKLLTILLDRGDFSQHDTAGLKEVIQNAGRGALLHLVEEYDVQWLSGRATPPKATELAADIGCPVDRQEAAEGPRPAFPSYRVAADAFFARKHGGGDALEAATQLLTRKASEAATCVLYGMAGVGKSAVAEELCRRFMGVYEDGIHWINAETPVSSFAAVAEAIEPLTGNRWLGGDQQRQRKVRQWLGSRRRWLLVIDNADHLPQVNRCLGNMQVTGHLVITSRRGRKAWEDWVTAKRQGLALEVIKVETLSRGAALKLLFQVSQRKVAVPDELEAACTLVGPEFLDGLPLAIRQAGTTIHAEDVSFSDYIQRYRDELFSGTGAATNAQEELRDYLLREVTDADAVAIIDCVKDRVNGLRGLSELTDKEVEDLKDLGGCERQWLKDYRRSVDWKDHRLSIQTTWRLTLTTIEKGHNGPNAMLVLRTLAWLSPDDVYMPLLLRLLPGEDSLTRAMEELEMHSLVTRRDGNRIHRVLQEFVREEQTAPEATVLTDLLASHLLALSTTETAIPQCSSAALALMENVRHRKLQSTETMVRLKTIFALVDLTAARECLAAAKELRPPQVLLQAHCSLLVAWRALKEDTSLVEPALEEAHSFGLAGAGHALRSWRSRNDPLALRAALFELLHNDVPSFVAPVRIALRKAVAAEDKSSRLLHARRAMILEEQHIQFRDLSKLEPLPSTRFGAAVLIACELDVPVVLKAYRRTLTAFHQWRKTSIADGQLYAAGIAAGLSNRLATLCKGQGWDAMRDDWLSFVLTKARRHHEALVLQLCEVLILGEEQCLALPLIRLDWLRDNVRAQNMELLLSLNE